MAKPIEATPILTGKDARKLLDQIEERKRPSAKSLKKLKECTVLYKKFYKILLGS